MSLSLLPRFKRAALATFVAVAALPIFAPSLPARAAATVQIGLFHASCSAFSVEASITGRTDDQAGFDRFRFEITDGTGRLLYREDSFRGVGVADTASVLALPYQNGLALANPIRFAIIDLDTLARPQQVLQSQSFNAACLTNQLPSLPFADLLSGGIEAPMRQDSTLYATANGAPTPYRVLAGERFTALYSTADNAWVAIYVGGENLVWIPSGSIDLNAGALAVLPNQIDRSQQVSTVVLPGAPVATAKARYTANFRLGPSTSFGRIGRVPFGTTVPVYGRSSNSAWLLITYNSVGGWVSASLFRLNETTVRSLPIVG
jgi:hypothetical protein